MHRRDVAHLRFLNGDARNLVFRRALEQKDTGRQRHKRQLKDSDAIPDCRNPEAKDDLLRLHPCSLDAGNPGMTISAKS